MKLAYKTLRELQEMISTGEVTSREIWDYFIQRNEKYNSDIKAFLNIGLKEFEDKNDTPLMGLPL